MIVEHYTNTSNLVQAWCTPELRAVADDIVSSRFFWFPEDAERVYDIAYRECNDILEIGLSGGFPYEG